MSPAISVIMPVYNSASYLKEAIESILRQSYADFELIIIDDGSKDNSLEIAKSYSDDRIKILCNEKNLGIIETRNKGLLHASGKYIAMMDSDDISLPDRFGKQFRFLEDHPSVAIVASKLALIDENGTDKGVWHEDVHATSIERIRKTMPVINCIGQSTVMMRSDIVKPIGYNKNYKFNEDWGLWLDVLSGGHIVAKLDEFLIKYRVHTQSSSASANVSGVPKNLGRFKKSYLKQQLTGGKINRISVVVLISAIKEYLVYYTKQGIVYLMPGMLDAFTAIYRNPKKGVKDLLIDMSRDIKRLLTISPLKVFAQYRELKNLYKANEAAGIFFFFPYCHIGGAEKVHANIVEVFTENKPVVFFTGISFKDDFLYMFKEHAHAVNVGFCLNHIFTRRRSTRMIFKFVESQKNPVIFGCNNLFFSNSVLKFSKKVRVFDLMHDFRFEGEDNLTHTFLEQYLRCEKRIFISRMAIEQVRLFYKSKMVAAPEYEKLKLIQNYTFLPESLPMKDFNGIINVLYVGRGTTEKRAHLVGVIAKRCSEKKLPLKFTAIGELEHTITEECKEHLSCTGPIYQFSELENYYKSHHIILITSEKEGFPLAIMEGMAHGLIPVSTPVGDVPYHVANSVGFISSGLEENLVVDQISAALEVMLKDRTAMARSSERAYNYAKFNFSREKFQKEYKEIIRIT